MQPQFPTSITLSNSISTPLPEEYHFQDVRYTPELVSYFVERYTSPGATVFDPFAGFGTTLLVARQLGRHPYGVEIDADKIDYLRSYHDFGEELLHGDIKRLILPQSFPCFDFVMTSPPYMGQEDTANALTGYRYAGSYEQYLEGMQVIFKQLLPRLSEDAVVVVEIANLKQEHRITTLAWDVGRKLAEIMEFQGEIIVNWIGERAAHPEGLYNYGYDHSYCLVYTPSSL